MTSPIRSRLFKSLALLTSLGTFLVLALSYFPLISVLSSGGENAPSEINSPTPSPTACIACQGGGDDNKQHLLAASYYKLADNLTTILMLNNKGPRPLEVHPTLFNRTGERRDLPVIIVAGTSFREINFADYGLAGTNFEEGSLQLTHKGKDLILGAQVKLVDAQHSLIFEEKLTELATEFKTSRLESLWWLPSRKSEVQLVLSNTSDDVLSVDVNVNGDSPRRDGVSSLTLAAHETRIISMRDMLLNGPGDAALPEVGGVSLTHGGAVGSLMARLLIADVDSGYSASQRFYDPQKAKSNKLQGAGLRIGSVGGERLTPVFVARNIGDAATTVTGRIPYTMHDGDTSVLTLPPLRLKPGETQLFKTTDALKGHSGRRVTAAGLEFEYEGTPGSVLMSAQSVSHDGNNVFHVPLWDIKAQKSSTGGYPWNLEGDSATIVYIKNVTDSVQKYALELNIEGSEEFYVMGVKAVEPGQTTAIDIRQLRDEQVPDEGERKIPLEATRGQVHWSVRSADKLPMIGRIEQFDAAGKMSNSYACQNCCGDSFDVGYLSPSLIANLPGSINQFVSQEQYRTCYGTLTQPNIVYGGDWSTAAIATVDYSGQATAVSTGTTFIRDTWTGYVSRWQPFYSGNPNEDGECVSDPIIVNGDGDMQVVTIEKLQYNVNGSWVDVPSGGMASVCPGSSIRFRAVATGGATWPSGQPTWSGDASGSGEEKTVTFSSSGSRTVSATAGNTVSVSVTVGPTNGTVAITRPAAAVTTSSANAASTTVDNPFTVTYTACADINNNVWRMRLASIEGGVSITINTGGSRNPNTNPPINQTEAQDAVNVMKAYYANGFRGTWHTPEASEAHEQYHYTEWKCSSDHYWPATETAIENLTVPWTSHSTEAAAITALRAGSGGADAKITAFTNASRTYWASLADNAGSRPYAAGQLTLNIAIVAVQNLAAANGWTVASGTNSPSTANPCYQSFPAFTP